MTHNGCSAEAQHSCCGTATHGVERGIYRSRVAIGRSQQRWQLVTFDLFRSHFRGGSEPVNRHADRGFDALQYDGRDRAYAPCDPGQ